LECTTTEFDDEEDLVGAAFYVPEHQVLQGAIENDLKDVVVAGIDDSGGLYVASSRGCEEARAMLERALQRIDELLEQGYESD